jgi:hypothetical protein
MSFSKDVKSFTQQYRRRMHFIAKTAVQEMATEASIPVAQSGRMPVDTSFLRSSLLGAYDGPPQGPTEGEPIQGSPLAAALIRWDPLKQTFWLGWTAHYATLMNIKYGYRNGAVEKWSMFVAKATREAQAKKL